MKRLNLQVHSRTNIALHLLVGAGFGYFAYDAGNNYAGGLMMALALMIFIDMGGCIWERIKLNKSGDIVED